MLVNFLNDLYSSYTNEHRKVIDELMNNHENVMFTNNFEKYPIIQFYENDIILWHQNENVSPHPHAFSEINEILFLIKQTFFDDSYIYISKKRN